jgi:hypothetical protein
MLLLSANSSGHSRCTAPPIAFADIGFNRRDVNPNIGVKRSSAHQVSLPGGV